jgi:RNA polymerase-binding protein DksA
LRWRQFGLKIVLSAVINGSSPLSAGGIPMTKKDNKKSDRKFSAYRADDAVIRALKKERQRLMGELKKQQVLSQDHPTTGNHMADDASDVAEQAKTLALRTHLERMLKQIDRAVALIGKGTYGLCEQCGKPIAEERLKAMPWATLCIEHAKLSQTPKLKATLA